MIKRFWEFLKEDSWQSLIVSLVLIVILIRFVFFPLLSLATGTALPLVVVESCSMYHTGNFDSWWETNNAWYENAGIEKNEFADFPFQSGLNKGDIIFVLGRSSPEKGDIIIFQPNPGSTAIHPIIHRVVTKNPLGTKGDNGRTNPDQLNGNNQQRLDETDISNEQIIGKATLRIPILGWIKLVFFEPLKPESQRGFCK